jgi:hypothetical protein
VDCGKCEDGRRGLLARQRRTRGINVGEAEHLNSHQRDTMAQIFNHPLSHNIEWHAVLSLLNSVATVQETHKGHMLVTLGDESETFDPHGHKDIDADQLTNLRRLLRKGGYGPDEAAE